MPSSEPRSRQGAGEERVTVADLLRRERMTGELPVVRDEVPGDDTPTERIPVVDILRREGRWDRRKASKVGAIAAGVAALAGVAVTALTTGQLHDNAASATGGAGGGYVPIDVPTSGPFVPAASSSSPAEQTAGTVTKAQASGSATTAATQAGAGQAGGGRPAAERPRSGTGARQGTMQDSAGSGASADSSAATTTTRSEPPAQSTSAPAAEPTSSQPATQSPTQQSPAPGGGLLGGITDLVGGLLGGGH